MKYNETSDDHALRKWFLNDFTRKLLRIVTLEKGSLRSVTPVKLEIQFPITAIAGKNGAGKSTILAMVCCAYHNGKGGFKLPRRKNPYYTFRDFFVQHTGEPQPQGVQLAYGMALNGLPKNAHWPEGFGIGYYFRKKAQGGKWNDYDLRPKRNVVFLGIERVVPHSERSQSRSYSKVFKSSGAAGWEEKVKEAVGEILERKYDSFELLGHSKYNLPTVKTGSASYSGFNMGAGENALFEIFSAIYACGSGALIVIDEIELGLHAGAQRRFMNVLKRVCIETKTQVICTTHAREIFNALPDDARYMIEVVNGKTRLTSGISADFAMARLGEKSGKELDLLVEDDVAQHILAAALSSPTRTRADIKRIGSASALARQLAAAYVRKDVRPVVAVFDGDQKIKEVQNINHAKDMAESPGSDFVPWMKARLCYLPGSLWPELWLVEKAKTLLPVLASALGSDPDELADTLEKAQLAGKHKEFSTIAEAVGLTREYCLTVMVPLICGQYAAELQDLVEAIENRLASGS